RRTLHLFPTRRSSDLREIENRNRRQQSDDDRAPYRLRHETTQTFSPSCPAVLPGCPGASPRPDASRSVPGFIPPHPLKHSHSGEIGRAHVELQSRENL